MHDSSSSLTAPSLINLEAARQRFGTRKVELLIDMARTGDQLMDAVIQTIDSSALSEANSQLTHGISHGLAHVDDPPPAVQALLEAVEAPPAWVEQDRLRRGSAAYLSIGEVWIILSLGPGSLTHTYSSPSIARVLMQTGNLVHMARRRIIETGLWEIATVLPEGLARGAEGYVHTLQVRALHARVRYALLKRGWDTHALGLPINQVEMARTWLDFTYVPFRALQAFGITFTEDELADLYHFWHYVAYLLGVDERLFRDISTQERAGELLDLIDGTAHRTNADSQMLTQAMLHAVAELLPLKLPPALKFDVVSAVTRRLHGHELADLLGVKRTWVSALMPVIARANRLRRARLRRNPAAWQAAIHRTAQKFQDASKSNGKTIYQ